jgi:starvation-inducible DNA-binding protein
MDKTELVERLKVVLGSAFSLYLKAHNYHWNVTGPNFGEYHDFFSEFYTKVHESIDLYAEHIRMLDAFAPGSLKRFTELTIISDEIAVPSPKFMFVRLSGDNDLFLNELKEVRSIADAMGEYGLVATLETQIQFHDKMRWMLKAYSNE